jgi:hypothetical protein
VTLACCSLKPVKFHSSELTLLIFKKKLVKHHWLTYSLLMVRLKSLKLKSDTKLEGSTRVSFSGSCSLAQGNQVLDSLTDYIISPSAAISSVIMQLTIKNTALKEGYCRA